MSTMTTAMAARGPRYTVWRLAAPPPPLWGDDVEVPVDELTPEELTEWASKPIDGAPPEDVERIVWAMAWREPEKAIARRKAALLVVGNETLNCGVEWHIPFASVRTTSDNVAFAWLRAIAALQGVVLEEP